MITKQDIELLLPHSDSLIQIASSNDFPIISGTCI